jgi:hypothetical protein
MHGVRSVRISQLRYRPWPVFDRVDDAGLHGVELHVHDRVREVRFVANQAILVACLEQCTATPVSFVERARVCAVQYPHSLGDSSQQGLENQVVVSVEEASRKDPPPFAERHTPQPDREALSVDVVPEDRTVVDSVGGQVVART